MATTIKLKNGSGAPLAGDLVQGEPALDLTNKRLYTENASGTVIEVGTNPTSLTTGTFTSTGIDDNATSTAITINASENVGIGTASPTSKLTIGTGASSAQIQFPNTTTNSFIGYDGSFDGLQLATNGPIKFQAGTSYTERMRIDASGNVGIGTTSPSAKLDISGAAPVLELTDTGSTASYGWQPTSNDLRLFDFNTSLERLRIDSSGNLLVGDTSPINSAHTFIKNQANNAMVINNEHATTPYGVQVRFSAANPNNTGSPFFEAYSYSGSFIKRFEVRSNGGIANYSSNNVNLSDQRAKKDIVNSGNYLEKLCNIPVRNFRYNEDAEDSKHHLGVIAQEVEAVAPEFVNKASWEYKNDQLDTVYNTDLMFAMMKSIQELSAQVNELKAEVSALKGE